MHFCNSRGNKNFLQNIHIIFICLVSLLNAQPTWGVKVLYCYGYLLILHNIVVFRDINMAAAFIMWTKEEQHTMFRALWAGCPEIKQRIFTVWWQRCSHPWSMVVLCQWHLFGRFWTSQSILTRVTVGKSSPYYAECLRLVCAAISTVIRNHQIIARWSFWCMLQAKLPYWCK
jgi:hypothetical protein